MNERSAVSRQIGEYYARRRAIPMANVCRVSTKADEDIAREVYDREIAVPVARCLQSGGRIETILYIVTTLGVPLRVSGSDGLGGDMAAVDSELALLYPFVKTGKRHRVAGSIPNPFFASRAAAFSNLHSPMYLVTRLAAYDFTQVRAMIDRALAARNTGVFVLDLKSDDDEQGNDWLRTAATRLPAERTVLDASTKVLYGQKNVIAFASWGSNDKARTQRFVGFSWLPGAIVTEYVSTNGRTFQRPPDTWNIGPWSDRTKFFAGAPQTLSADYLMEGATGASGHVAEPYLTFTPRPEYLFPAYYAGRNLAESFYLATPALSWQNIVLGDPLCSLGPAPRGR